NHKGMACRASQIAPASVGAIGNMTPVVVAVEIFTVPAIGRNQPRSYPVARRACGLGLLQLLPIAGRKRDRSLACEMRLASRRGGEVEHVATENEAQAVRQGGRFSLILRMLRVGHHWIRARPSLVVDGYIIRSNDLALAV